MLGKSSNNTKEDRRGKEGSRNRENQETADSRAAHLFAHRSVAVTAVMAQQQVSSDCEVANYHHPAKLDYDFKYHDMGGLNA